MRVDDVTFVEREVRRMTKERFISMHAALLWQGMGEDDRRKKLSDVYDRVCGRKKSREDRDNK